MTECDLVVQPTEVMPETSSGLGIVYPVTGSLNPYPGASLLCGTCGQSEGPWLLAAGDSLATVTCRCGQRGTHPQITAEVVARFNPPGPVQSVSTTLADAEKAFGFEKRENDSPVEE